MDLNLNIPCANENINLLLNDINSPYKLDEAFRHSVMHNNNITDSILDYYCTDIYAHIPPNYMPTILHGHTYFEIVYVLSGNCTNYSGNQTLQLSEGDFMIMAPNTIHAISAFDDSCRVVNIMLRSSIFSKIFFDYFSENNILDSTFKNVFYNNKTNTYIIFHSKKDSTIKTLVLNLLDEIPKKRNLQNQIKESYVQLIFAHLLNRYSAFIEIFNDNTNSTKHEVNLILSYMNEHYKSLKLKEFSAFFGYSQRQISRILINYTQKNFSENINSIKMRKASNFLQNENKTIEEISEDLGYSTSYGFRKNFINYFGVTPSQYRKNIKKNL